MSQTDSITYFLNATTGLGWMVRISVGSTVARPGLQWEGLQLPPYVSLVSTLAGCVEENHFNCRHRVGGREYARQFASCSALHLPRRIRCPSGVLTCWRTSGMRRCAKSFGMVESCLRKVSESIWHCDKWGCEQVRNTWSYVSSDIRASARQRVQVRNRCLADSVRAYLQWLIPKVQRRSCSSFW